MKLGEKNEKTYRFVTPFFLLVGVLSVFEDPVPIWSYLPFGIPVVLVVPEPPTPPRPFVGKRVPVFLTGGLRLSNKN